MSDEVWLVGEPGGPAGPFWSVTSNTGRVIAMQVTSKEFAEEIASLHPPKSKPVFHFDERSLVVDVAELAALPQFPLCTCGYGGGPSVAHQGDCPMRIWE